MVNREILVESGLIVLLYMTAVFIFALVKKNNSIVDIFWGPGFIILTLYSLFQNPVTDFRKIIVTLLVILWAMRLSVHIYLRNKGNPEDFRYKHWRNTWKFFILRSYFQIFILQGILMLVIAAPVYFINFYSSEPLGVWDSLGLVVFGCGFLIETLGDQELISFKKDPANKGMLMTTGLWKYSRHPNYFGESLVWWGLALYALSVQGGWMTLISPIVLTLLLRFVSGVPMLEKKFESRPGWEEYKAKTAAFVPFIRFL